MAYYYFPSCKATAQFKEASKKARAYVKELFGINPIGCCRPNHKKLTAEDTALAHKRYVEQFPHRRRSDSPIIPV